MVDIILVRVIWRYCYVYGGFRNVASEEKMFLVLLKVNKKCKILIFFYQNVNKRSGTGIAKIFTFFLVIFHLILICYNMYHKSCWSFQDLSFSTKKKGTCSYLRGFEASEVIFINTFNMYRNKNIQFIIAAKLLRDYFDCILSIEFDVFIICIRFLQGQF